MLSMTSHAHSLNLTAGFYYNNCICQDSCSEDKCYNGDVAALLLYGFDSVKLDACGAQMDLQKYSDLFKAAGKNILIENCHWGGDVPTKENPTCPHSHYYRVSADIRASYGGVNNNFKVLLRYSTGHLSKPGCWAYGDMLQVGVKDGVGGREDTGLSLAEARSHFGSWCIVSSPLFLGNDLNDDVIMDQVWPIIANKEAIEVNQAWAGHSGRVFQQAEEEVDIPLRTEWVVRAPKFQYLFKPVDSHRVAVLLMNHAPTEQRLTLDFAAIPGVTCRRCHVRDIWTHMDLGIIAQSYSVSVEGHDAAFLMISLPDRSEHRTSILAYGN